MNVNGCGWRYTTAEAVADLPLDEVWAIFQRAARQSGGQLAALDEHRGALLEQLATGRYLARLLGEGVGAWTHQAVLAGVPWADVVAAAGPEVVSSWRSWAAHQGERLPMQEYRAVLSVIRSAEG